MEQFKLDLTKLTPVEEANRIMGNWYVVADYMENTYPVIRRWHSGNRQMEQGGEQVSVSWAYWFAIQPNLPGFPVAELPDEFELKKGEWEYTNIAGQLVTIPMNSTFRRIKIQPEISIPSGTKSEQIEAVKKLLAELETK